MKFPVGRSAKTDKLVKLKVNGKDIRLSMKLGSAGEAFFVERTARHEFVIKRLRASPPLGTAQKDGNVQQQCTIDTSKEVVDPPLCADRTPSSHTPISRYTLTYCIATILILLKHVIS